MMKYAVSLCKIKIAIIIVYFFDKIIISFEVEKRSQC